MTTEAAIEKTATPIQTVNPPIQMYYLRRHNNGTIYWDAPDGNTYGINPADAKPYQWLIVNDVNGKPVMAFYTKPNIDAILEVSIDGANSVRLPDAQRARAPAARN